MGHLLFSPEGTIGKADFSKGAVILLAANFVLWLAWLINFGVGGLVALASLMFIYCWGCLFVKRFKAAAKPGAMFILVFFGFVFLSYILSQLLAIALSPDLVSQMEEMQALSESDPENIEALMPLADAFMRALVVPYAVAYFIAGAFIAFAINANMNDNFA